MTEHTLLQRHYVFGLFVCECMRVCVSC